MGFLGSLTGSDGARAAHGAADIQSHNIKNAKDRIKNNSIQAKKQLAPFADAGRDAVGGLSDLITNPETQRQYVEDNPFFNAMADNAQSRVFNNAAARGKTGSGGTAEALQNSILLMGNDLVSQNINQRQNLVNTGLSAAGGQAGIYQERGRSLADLEIQNGNVQAAGIVGAAANRAAGAGNIMNTALSVGKLALCDRRYKENIEKAGTLNNGLDVYWFNYIGDDQRQLNVMADEVQDLYPKAVHEIDGVMYVDHGAIH